MRYKSESKVLVFVTRKMIKEWCERQVPRKVLGDSHLKNSDNWLKKIGRYAKKHPVSVPGKKLLVILMRYSYDDGPPPEDYPGLTGLAKKTGLTKRIVQDTLKALEYKGIIKKQARYMARKKAHLSNLYIVRDVPSMWLPDTINNSMDLDITDAISRKCILYKRMFVQQSIDNVTPKRVILLR